MTTALVSIIVPVFNQFAMTARCLAALAGSTAVPYQLLVVDNASTDATAGYLAALERGHAALRDPALARPAGHASPWLRGVPVALRVLRNAENRGFVDACNQAAAEAAGRYLCFLNNDTEPQPGWLDAMVAVAEGDPAVGAVGAKLLWPDGRIQEAGGVIFRDAAPMRYGEGWHRFDPAGNYRREVDYCCGAALLVPRSLFAAAGGFDRRYAPAYFEDTDLCFTLRQMGYKVVYQPHAEVVHHEAATAGRDPSQGHRAFLVSNRETFRAKWRDVLEARHWPKERYAPLRVANRAPGSRILWVDRLLPMRDRASGSRRLWELLALLVRQGHHVTFVPAQMLVGPDTRRYVHELQSLGVETFAVDPASGWPPGGPVQPMHLAAKLVERGGYDLAVFSTHHVAGPLTEVARKAHPSLPVLADSVDVHFVREEREAALAGDPELFRTARQTRQSELAAYAAADAVIAVTAEDARPIREALPGKRIFVIPNVHDPVGDVPGFAQRKDLLFVGNFQHPPNGDAVRWLHAEILPLLRQRLPGVKVHVVGNRCPPEVDALAAEDFVVHGYVQDLGVMLRAARVSIAPLRYGAGMKGKVGEALAWGLPCVTTSIGAEGMDLVNGEHLLVADDAVGFAGAVARLYGDRALWDSIARQGRDAVATRYGRQAVGPMLQAMVAQFASPPVAGAVWRDATLAP